MRTLSTCGRCGGTIERRPGSVAGWGHVTETARNADGHLPDPDDGYAATGADEHEEESARLPHHQPGCPELWAVTPGRDGCTCPRPRPDEQEEESYADPWLDPDAAARAVPPPF